MKKKKQICELNGLKEQKTSCLEKKNGYTSHMTDY